MRPPSLKELPPPPQDKTGWPWTRESPQLLDVMPDRTPWPPITIVTPSYNQAEYIEETIRSVLLQGYPNLEYIVIDGGSTDSSVRVIKKYARWINSWMSEKDQGQSDALNKGFSLSNGELLTYLNSDDIFLPKVLRTVALSYVEKGRFKWLASPILLGESLSNNRVWKPQAATFPIFVSIQTIAQPGVFWTADSMPRPYFDNEKHLCMDHKFFAEIYLKYGPPRIIKDTAAFYRKHLASKTSRLKMNRLKDESQKLVDEIIIKVDTQTVINIKKEALIQKAVHKIQEILNDDSKSSAENRKMLVEALKILIKASFSLGEKAFFSLLVRSRMRQKSIVSLFLGLLRQI